jgi:hypothetical protein
LTAERNTLCATASKSRRGTAYPIEIARRCKWFQFPVHGFHGYEKIFTDFFFKFLSV